MYFVYIIKNVDNNLYVGVSANPEKRLQIHNQKRGAQFTKSRDMFHIVFLEQYKTLADARSREIQIKKWRRHKKDMLIDLYKNGKETRQQKTHN